MVCLNEDTKEELLKIIPPTSSSNVKIADFIGKLPECTVEDTKTGKKGKRSLTRYNVFLSSCMKSKGKDMKACIVVWREIKACVDAGSDYDKCKTNAGY